MTIIYSATQAQPQKLREIIDNYLANFLSSFGQLNGMISAISPTH
jgi:hypothetical protein